MADSKSGRGGESRGNYQLREEMEQEREKHHLDTGNSRAAFISPDRMMLGSANYCQLVIYSSESGIILPGNSAFGPDDPDDVGHDLLK